MILISNIIDSYFNLRLSNKSFRNRTYQKAINQELRKSKLGVILLRNLHEKMANNTTCHEEFNLLINEKDFQQVFWESDLGYLWYQGNLNNQNAYFNFAIEQIKNNNISSLLDVGCGWGEFPNKVSSILEVDKVYGIDISEDIIEKAKALYPNTKVIFECKNVLDVEGQYDLITLFGSTDYIDPSLIQTILEKIIQSANKQILIVNSLRNMSLKEVLELEKSIEIKRYDVGYIHPLKNLITELQQHYNFNCTFEKFGKDSLLVNIKF